MTLVKTAASPPITIPGTSYPITSYFLRFTLTTQQTSLAAGDNFGLIHFSEGPVIRGLSSDVHSIQLLVRTSVPGLQFGLALAAPATPYCSLVKLATLTQANVWTLLTFPNLPVFPSAANFSLTPGTNPLFFMLTLSSGSNTMASANDVWLNTQSWGAVGQSNFAASPVNSTFDVAFIQWEPGPECSALIDLPFEENLSSCQRYYCKSNSYGTASPTNNDWRSIGMWVTNTTSIRTGVAYPVEMAKVPTVRVYDNGVNLNKIYLDSYGSLALNGAQPGLSSTAGFGNIVLAANPGTAWTQSVLAQWNADTGW
jgi:hypothetical protein